MHTSVTQPAYAGAGACGLDDAEKLRYAVKQTLDVEGQAAMPGMNEHVIAVCLCSKLFLERRGVCNALSGYRMVGKARC